MLQGSVQTIIASPSIAPAENRRSRSPSVGVPREQQTRADLMAFRNTLGHRARGKRLLHNPKLVGRRPTPPPLTANPYLDLLRKIALKRPLTSLV
jgi:hypothetical protein